MKKFIWCMVLTTIVSTLQSMEADSDHATSGCCKPRVHRAPQKKAPKTTYTLVRHTPPVIMAVLQDDSEKLKKALIDVNQKDGIGWTALHYAARDLNVELAKILLDEKGIDVHARNGQGHTARQIIEYKTPTEEEQCDWCMQFLALLDAKKTQAAFAKVRELRQSTEFYDEHE